MVETAAALIIGNEVLTGKVAEQNTFVLAKELFMLGISLRRIVVCPDEISLIARDLLELSASHGVVVTSGGVGPTHDDVTIKAVAHAFGRKVERSPTYEALLRGHYGAALTDMHLRMADVPSGSRLVTTPDMPWPTVVTENVFVFPGVPQIFKAKLPVLRQELASDKRFYARAVYVMLDEPQLAPLLDRVSAAHAEVSVGSYLLWGKQGDYRTKLTVDGRNEQAVEACFQELLGGIAASAVVRTE